ncbi:hypothetical protein [Methanobrevibacter olleyae]|uniref:Uncharacterized protein n=1 Tax=Methanobrevibacter olleyae TaxID=294671 RepID=A0A126R0A6_METOL|nr:hypothetical protein [Methanobrevibacter olleyae]AMK15810.1 hypothetical protein YLM1_1253 [Methanobrevibacter olleyae]SFL19672.1 hypothetical protein SAMN02910297_00178 [Methanobrevibacter olleyae]
MDKTNSNYSSEYLLNFSFSKKRLSSKVDAKILTNSYDSKNINSSDSRSIGFSDSKNINSSDSRSIGSSDSKNSMSSNVISETSLEEDCILLKKKSLLKRKSMGSLKIFYSEIIDLKLKKSDLSTLYSSIEIIFSKNGYSKHLISLTSSDSFAVRWFYDGLVLKHSLSKSNSNLKTFKSNEQDYIKENKEAGEDKKNSNRLSKDSILDDFMNQMNTKVSQKREKEISKQMKFDRCSSGEY